MIITSSLQQQAGQLEHVIVSVDSCFVGMVIGG